MIHEKLSQNVSEHLFYLPPFEPTREPPSLYPTYAPRFNDLHYAHNRQLLLTIAHKLTHHNPQVGRELLNIHYPIAQVDQDEALKVMHNLAIQDTFPRPTQQESRSVQDILRHSPNNTLVFSSPTHTTDADIIESMLDEKKGTPPHEIGILMFDTHYDGLYRLDRGIGRSSFINHIRDLGVTQMSIIGVPDELVHMYVHGPQIPEKWSAFFDQFAHQPSTERDLRSALSRYPDLPVNLLMRYMTHQSLKSDAGHNTQFIPRSLLGDPQLLILQIINQLKRMKSKGVKELYTSIDVDVLNLLSEMITCTMYSPFSKVLSFGLQSLPESILDKDPHEAAQEFNVWTQDTSLSTPPGGISGTSLLEVIRKTKKIAQELGIEFGVTVGDKKVIGSIMEIGGPDFNKNMQNLLKQIMDQLVTTV